MFSSGKNKKRGTFLVSSGQCLLEITCLAISFISSFPQGSPGFVFPSVTLIYPKRGLRVHILGQQDGSAVKGTNSHTNDLSLITL